MTEEKYYRSRLRAKGQITIPIVVREHLNVKEGGDLLFYKNEKGQYVVEAAQVISPDQAWFWSERWQKMEHEA